MRSLRTSQAGLEKYLGPILLMRCTRQPPARINVPTHRLVEKIILHGNTSITNEALRLVPRAQPCRLGGVECRAEPLVGDKPVIDELACADHNRAPRFHEAAQLIACHG